MAFGMSGCSLLVLDTSICSWSNLISFCNLAIDALIFSSSVVVDIDALIFSSSVVVDIDALIFSSSVVVDIFRLGASGS